MKPAALIQMAFIVVAGIAVFAFVTMAKDSEARRSCVPVCAMRPNYAGQNRLAPDFELTDENGAKVKLSQFRGKTVVLNFWTTTCQPCLEEMPSLADLAKIVKKRSDVVVLTVSTDTSKEVALSALQTLLHEPKPPFPVLLDSESSVVREKYGTQLFPETWLIDPQGVIRARFDGARDWSNAMILDLIDSFSRSTTCGVEFQAGKATGPEATACDESSG
ncbi:MAG TPA: TlpA disulfide reductase family protein [Polyangiaceae bacterium]|nr:TlpA disulfide reductase family protein [Polyangiaceae bacterium]